MPKLLLVAILLITPTFSQAEDGDLQRALLEAPCANAKVTRLPSVGKSEIYEANCLGSSHKRIKIVCISGRCVADGSNTERKGRDDLQ
ncbi:hypothetical protein [Bosea sp. (in: a-proteobacteria)]|jgi:hypothetical protein|uniref:hypothetical protein n=1 Tax=Bosea sp. (in: a-proteobacteria) TaxID=1871050 RepID=UPI002B46513C|nr:hypothetical protein [Bosea sp. (in: a-proteobacteria)]WRH56120.1 MAG: hypothetical protein RSE11_13770 [Bosea sp. (in: a-proteobacteria)]